MAAAATYLFWAVAGLIAAAWCAALLASAGLIIFLGVSALL